MATGGPEQGLLSIAFHPDFARNGRVFASYTDRDGHSVVARYRVRADDPDRLDPGSAEVVLRVEQPYANHSGGLILFGPDGYLYVGLGDGGGAGDPHGHGQNRNTLLGALLRLDVDGERGYAIPADNPFARGGGRPEIWAFGLRNPWRFSFDRETGDLYIGDVGQDAREEIDFQPAGHRGGRNYGWSVWEGTRRFRPDREPVSEVTFPVAEYDNPEDGCAVTRAGTSTRAARCRRSAACTSSGTSARGPSGASGGAGTAAGERRSCSAPTCASPPSARTRRASCTWSTTRGRYTASSPARTASRPPYGPAASRIPSVVSQRSA